MAGLRYSMLRDFIGASDYDLSTDPNNLQADLLSPAPHWVLAVVRFKFPVTFSRIGGQSANNDSSVAAVAGGDILIIHQDCINLQVQSTKTNHAGSLAAVLTGSTTINYLSEILPGDWIFAWIVNSENKANDLMDRIRKMSACNKFDDGFKFVGRVQNVRKTFGISDMGVRTLRYNVQALAFREFDSTIFYDPHLAQNVPTMGLYFATYNLMINNLIKQAGGGVDINLMMPALFDMLLGVGIPPTVSNPASQPQTQIATGGTNTPTAPYAYAVPKEVGQLLGRTATSSTGGVLTYADCLEILYGIQRYQGTKASLTGYAPEYLFKPDGIQVTPENHKNTGWPLLGIFTPQMTTFTNRSVWTILNEFLNPAVNEMYTTLRVNSFGSVVPTLVVRQLPFTTDLYATAAQQSSVYVTPFLELPRWHAHPILVKSADIGRSDALRFNFIQILAQDNFMKANDSFVNQVIRNPPFRDETDIKRSGCRPYQMTIACSQKDSTGAAPTKWMGIASDFIMEQHLRLTGTFTLVGIEAPICPGDNFEFDGVVYHIESVTHNCSVANQGIKNFTTSVTCSHGVTATPGPNDSDIYYGLNPADVSIFEPTVTSEIRSPDLEQSMPSGRTLAQNSGTKNPTATQVAPDGLPPAGLA